MLRSCVERVDMLQLKGIKADREALAFCAGYAAALFHAGIKVDLSKLVWVISIRGMVEVRNLAAELDAEG
jgi:hypothetical protein